MMLKLYQCLPIQTPKSIPCPTESPIELINPNFSSVPHYYCPRHPLPSYSHPSLQSTTPPSLSSHRAYIPVPESRHPSLNNKFPNKSQPKSRMLQELQVFLSPSSVSWPSLCSSPIPCAFFLQFCDRIRPLPSEAPPSLLR